MPEQITMLLENVPAARQWRRVYRAGM